MNTEDLASAVLVRRYRLLRPIGEGGMGVVYEAQDTDNQSRCAVKLLRREFVNNAAVTERFLDEAKACQRLAHPNVVQVFDVRRAEDGTPFFVMEFLDGAPLAAYLKGGSRIPVPDAANVLHGVLSGLAAAHAAGIVHRDLKPENVVLARDTTPGGSGGLRAKILDFGIAKVMDLAGGMGARTQTGMLLGTPAYMSPEQIRNAKEVDARSDLFACGALFYEMLSGRQAFGASNEFAKLTAVLTTEPEPLERIDPSLASLGAFVSRALAKDRNIRFQSADEMLGALSHVMAGYQGSLRPPGASAAPPGLSGAPALLASVGPAPAGKSSTLASAPSVTFHDRIAEVTVDGGGSRRVVPAWMAALLVSAALFFGFLLGLAVGRTM